MKVCFILVFVVLFMLDASAQTLQRVSLKADDSLKDTLYRYEYIQKDHLYAITLFLLKDSSYFYCENGCLINLFSKGRWRLSKGTLLLNSEIQKESVPVLLSLTKDTIDVVNNFKFGVVKNIKGDYLTDVFVNVNTDTVRCLPMAGGCVGSYKTIDSVRLMFENGFMSKWLPVKDDRDSHILLRVNTDLNISSFIPFRDFKYKLTKRYLKPISKRD